MRTIALAALGMARKTSAKTPGEMYVVYGGPQRRAAIDLAGDPPADLTVIYGADGGGNSPDRLGEEIVLADIDGQRHPRPVYRRIPGRRSGQ